jgi:pSer/pThr/pTyr-binding forkhead associated (FHA) protein
VGHDGGAYWLEDAGSTNGTRLGGARLVPGERRPLPPGAELHLAEVRLRFEGAAPAAAAVEPSEGTATIARRLVADLFAEAIVPALTISSGAPPRSLPLTDEARAYVVGRAETCALPLDAEHVSREHAAFVRSAAGVVVRELGSKNGVLVNGARIAGEHPLADRDTIQIGAVALTLEDPISRYLRELELSPEPPAAPPPETAPGAPPPARPSSFARLSTIVSVVVLAAIVVLSLALLR